MFNVQLPPTVKVGGFDYQIEVNQASDRELESRQHWGEHSDYFKRVRIHSKASPQQFSLDFIHELLIHAVDSLYLGDSLTETQATGLASGIHQVLEELGVRFTYDGSELAE